MLLKDKVIIVTGAAQGLGQEFACRFAQEGAYVVVADRQNAQETLDKIKAAGGEGKCVQVDIADSASVAEMAKEAASAKGWIDGLVNNAGVYMGLTMLPFDELSEAEWDKVMTVNVKGTWNCCRLVYPYMKEKGGSIVNVSSGTILEGHPYFTHYVASKGAVWAMSRSISRNLGQYNIRVNSITPGYTMTQTSKDLAGDPEKYEENYNMAINARALKRAMMPEDVVGPLVYLMSDDSAFITGQNLHVDGGALHY